jgi:hypothetical protein
MASRPVSVIELESYRRRAEEVLTAEERDTVVNLIAYAPLAGKIIPGTGGLRKLRVARDGTGKRGGARVVYYFYNEAFPVFLLSLYPKNEKADLSASDKRILTKAVKEIFAPWQKQ